MRFFFLPKKYNYSLFTNDMDQKLKKWILCILNYSKFQCEYIDDTPFAFCTELNKKKQINVLIESIYTVTFNILHQFINNQKKTINIKYLQMITSSCFIISVKLILSHDYLQQPECSLYKDMTQYSQRAFTIKQLKKFESYMIQRINWKKCDITTKN